MKTVLLAAVLSAGLVLAGCGKSEEAHNHDGHKDEHAAAKSWTCPMHPEVKSDKEGKCPKCGMALVEAKTDAGHGGDPVKVSSKGFDDSVAQMESRLKNIDALIASGKLDEVHKEAEVIRDLAKEMPAQTQGWPADKASGVSDSSGKLAALFEEIDEAADGGKPDETKAATAKMRELVGKLKAFAPAPK